MHVQVYKAGDRSTDRTCSTERSVVRCFDKALVQLFQVENCAWWRHRAAPGLAGQPRVPSLLGEVYGRELGANDHAVCTGGRAH